jgi:hypothetical protein
VIVLNHRALSHHRATHLPDPNAMMPKAWNRKGRPVVRTAPYNQPERGDYIAFVVVPFDIELSFDIIELSFDIIEPFDIELSFDIMLPLSLIAPSTAVMLSDIVSMPSVALRSVTIVLSVVVSVFGPQAETISAAPAIIEPVSTLEMSARIWKLPR